MATLASVNSAGTDSGNFASASAVVSGNGRFVAFTSDASDLVANDTNNLPDVFVRDLATGTTTLVSVNATGTASANGASANPTISADGLTVAFTSTAADLVGTDTNGLADIFARDLSTNTTTLVSVNVEGNSGNGPSANPIISADGRVVAFTTLASDLGPIDTNGVTDVYARTLPFGGAIGSTDLISANQTGTNSGNSASAAPVLSANGQFVAFTSDASDLVFNDNNGLSDVFHRLRGAQAGASTLVSISMNGNSGNGASAAATISADGQVVAFTSDATNLVNTDTNGLADVFARNLATADTTLVSVNVGRDSGNGPSANPTISADGRVVAFTTTASDLGPLDTNGVTDVYARPLQFRGVIDPAELISVDTVGDSGNGASASVAPKLSADGRFVAFTSEASDLVAVDTNGQADVFVRDRAVGTRLASLNVAGTDSGNLASAAGSISDNGLTVAFTSEASDLVPVDSNLVTDVFVQGPFGQLQFSSPTFAIDEATGLGSATITVTRVGGSLGPVTVNYATSDGTATAGADYGATAGTLTFLDGETDGTFTVPIVADNIDESMETLNLTLSNPTGGATLGDVSSAVLVIDDANATPTISVGDVTVIEGDGGTPIAVFTVTLSGPSDRAVTVRYDTADGTATAGVDYTTTGGTLNFTPGETTRTVSVPLLADSLSEPDETFFLNLRLPSTSSTIGDGQGLATIVDDDPAPVGNPDTFAATEDTTLIVGAPGLLANDTGGPPLTAVLATGPANGTLVLNPDGSFSFTPNPNFNGTDSFTYQASDGTNLSAPIVVTLAVAAVNDAPVARPDTFPATEDTALRIPAPGLLANDTDADGNPITAVLLSGPANGTVVVNPDGSFTFTPNLNFNGTDSFTYRASDGTNFSAPVTVTIPVAAVDDAPVARPDTFAISSTTFTAGGSGVLANDTNAEGTPLNAVLVSGPANGTLILNPNGSFTFTPNAGFNGSDSFTYLANDGTSNSAPVTVSLAVTGSANPGPAIPGPANPGTGAPIANRPDRFGFHRMPTILTLSFNRDMDPGQAQDVSRYRLIAPGRDGRLGTADDVRIAVRSASYDAASRTVTLRSAQRLSIHVKNRLIVGGMSSQVTANRVGIPLDGDGDGQPGGDAVFTFGREALRGPRPSAPGVVASRNGTSPRLTPPLSTPRRNPRPRRLGNTVRA